MGVAAIPYVLMAASAVVAASGAQQAAAANRDSANFRAQVSLNNQQISQKNSELATAAGAEQAAEQGLKTKAVVGKIKAAQAASNIDVNSGSAVDVRSSASELGQLDALTVRSNAARAAYGFDVQASNYGAQSQLDRAEAKNATQAGDINALSSLLGGASQGASQYKTWSMMGGDSSGGRVNWNGPRQATFS